MSVNPWNEDRPKHFESIWLNSTDVIEWIQRKTSKDPQLHWLNYSIDNYFGPAIGGPGAIKKRSEYRCLILGASEGWMERRLCERGFQGEIIATDIADKALKRAAEKAREKGYTNIRYEVADLNTATFKGPFDYIIAEGVLHHIVEIERCLKMLSETLSPTGYMFAAEWEGPVRFQLPELQVRWINAALNVLPKALRPIAVNGDGNFPGSAQENAICYYVPPSEQSVAEADPSEAICGPRLKKAIADTFDIVERNPFGGTLLAYMTQHFDFQKANSDEFSREWLKVLMHIEDTAIKTGILEDEYVFYVLRKKKG